MRLSNNYKLILFQLLFKIKFQFQLNYLKQKKGKKNENYLWQHSLRKHLSMINYPFNNFISSWNLTSFLIKFHKKN